MTEDNKLETSHPSVQTHLEILQGVVQRMASNSSQCKTWCITTVSAILVVVSGRGNSDLALLALFPTFLFFLLDQYYLSLEKSFRESYNEFVKKIHEGAVCLGDLYLVEPKGQHSLSAIGSPSIWIFYSGLAGLIVLARWLFSEDT